MRWQKLWWICTSAGCYIRSRRIVVIWKFVNGWKVRVWEVVDLCIEMTIVDWSTPHLLISGKPTKMIPEHFCDIGWTQFTTWRFYLLWALWNEPKLVSRLWTSHKLGRIFLSGCPKLPLEMHEGEAPGISCEGRTILSKLSPNVFPR